MILSELLACHGISDEEDIEWIHLLVEDWQLIADLSFADLVLWVRDGEDSENFRVVAHCRPTTGSSVYPNDEIGTVSNAEERDVISQAFATGKTVVVDETGTLLAGAEAVPVVREGRVLAVVTQHAEEARRLSTSRMERNYRSAAVMILAMVEEGTFPDREAPSGVRRGEPRVGDGLILLNREGRVRYASPNGVSVLHRLGHSGEIEGRYLTELVSNITRTLRPVDEILPLVLTGRAPWRTELEAKRVSVSLRAIPLSREGYRTGAVILLRDVSEIRRRERDLLSRDAMIREMHHRVKNNLQTVSALLRLQLRRISSDEAREALEEAMRRVSIIAVVHDVLSQGVDSEVDFNEVVDKGLKLTPELASPLVEVTLKRTGSFGSISSADATTLALALTELVTNAVEHGFPEPEDGQTVQGSVWVTPRHYDDRLEVTIADNGVGLGENKSPGQGLGTQIVRTLISTDLDGTIEWSNRPGGGTQAVIDMPLRGDV